jgi:hypothetical protein
LFPDTTAQASYVHLAMSLKDWSYAVVDAADGKRSHTTEG